MIQNLIRLNTLRISYTLTHLVKDRTPQVAGSLLSFIWFRPVNRRPHPHFQQLARSSRIRTIRVGGRKIKLRTWSHSEKPQKHLVLVHGWGGCWDQFAMMIQELCTKGYQVSAFDFPAHGETGGYSTDLWEWMEILQALQKEIGSEATWICHSFGLIAVTQAYLRGLLPVSQIVALNSPHRFSFLVEQFMEKVKVHEELKPYLLKGIERRVGPNVDQVASVSFQALKGRVPILFVADKSDREVPFSEHVQLSEILGPENLMVTEGLGHNGVLRDSQVFERIVKFI